jgi:hypothetical protein
LRLANVAAGGAAGLIVRLPTQEWGLLDFDGCAEIIGVGHRATQADGSLREPPLQEMKERACDVPFALVNRTAFPSS